MRPTCSKSRPRLVRAAAVVDGAGRWDVPGALLVEGLNIRAAGTPQQVGAAGEADIIDLPSTVVMPGLVNAHTHLDLTHIGPQTYRGSFVEWVDGVRRARATDEARIAESVRQGVRLARAGGTAFIGDIAGARSLIPVLTLRDMGLPGVSFVEVFGLGTRQQAAIDFIRQLDETAPANERGVRLGVQPHAPYSCGLDVYRAAAQLGRPLATHLAETLEELEFVQRATGDLTAFLRRLGVWDETIRGVGCHPIQHLAEMLESAPWLAAHVNYVDGEALHRLARWSMSVAYCPRASAYFGHPRQGRPPHLYADMMAAGVNVCLGTDSMICLDTPDRISVLDEIRLLYRRDGTSPATLLRMATVNGARALGVSPALVSINPGPVAGLIAIEAVTGAGLDPVRSVLESRAAPRWIVGPAEPGQ